MNARATKPARAVDPTTDVLRAHYARTSLARIGIPFERGIEVAGVRQAIAGAIRGEARRCGGCNGNA